MLKIGLMSPGLLDKYVNRNLLDIPSQIPKPNFVRSLVSRAIGGIDDKSIHGPLHDDNGKLCKDEGPMMKV
jgi:hypothetical protein